MPRLIDAVPKYQKHKASGQAVVTLNGTDHYLGPHGTKASKIEYDRLVAEWLANGRQPAATNDLTVVELMSRYWKHVKSHYVKNGRPTSEQTDIAAALRPVKRLYAEVSVRDFGPISLKAARQKLVESGYARTSINQHVHRIRRMFRWGVENELVPASVLNALQAVTALQRGKTEARETEPVGPVSDAVVDATLPHLPLVVADMVRFQRLTGCRPQEVCLLRPCDVDTSSEVWTYVPSEHKTEHHGKRRTIYIGPRAQEVLRPYLLRDSESHCFVPAESERQRLKARHEKRRISIKLGNRPGTNRKRKPMRSAGKRYDTPGYRRAITRGCEIAFGMPAELRDISRKLRKLTAEERERKLKAATDWRAEHCWSPNQLRHTAATSLRKQFGLEAAQVILGHSAADTTQIYAERDSEKAVQVMRQVG